MRVAENILPLTILELGVEFQQFGYVLQKFAKSCLHFPFSGALSI